MANDKKAGLNFLDLATLAGSLNEILGLVSACYSLAMQIAAKLGGVRPKLAVPKPGAKISVAGFLDMLRSLKSVLEQVLAMLNSGVTPAKFGVKRKKK